MAMFEILRKDYSDYLQQCYKINDVTTFQRKCIEQCANDTERKFAVDQALRDTLLHILIHKTSESVRPLESYITFCIELCRKDLATGSMPVMLLGDIFDSMTLDKCEELFTYVENNVVVWKEDLFFSLCKNNLLRMCNDLLRRLSRSQQTVFCGRILLFLAKFFPFSERSGLNIVSEFNLENLTEFGTEKAEDVLEPIIKDEDKTENKIPIDYSLYRKFWALQDFFRNPNQCYNKMHWKVFSAHASNVLSAFSSFKLEEQRSYPTICVKLDSAMEDSHKETHYFAKYLTNQKLLELQLSDSNFRRFLLLQFLILFQYLNSTVKFKAETHELKPDQVEWVKATTEQVYTLLTETPPDGPYFTETVKNILKREEHWNSWKNEGCPPFKRPASEITTEADDDVKKIKRLKRRIGEIIRDAQTVGKYHMGNPELTKLWNLCPNNLEACKSKDRDFLPSLETYFEEAIMQLDPSAMVEEEYKKVNDGNFGWRALRLLARRSPHFFVHGNYPINRLPEYLETMIKKIAKDRPQAQSDVKVETEDTPPPDSNDQEYTEVLKQESEQTDNENVDAKGIENKLNKVIPEMVAKLSELLKGDWKKLAIKLGYTNDEIAFFQSKPTPYEQCKNMLEIWAEEDEDASVENLIYLLEGLKYTEAASILKT